MSTVKSTRKKNVSAREAFSIAGKIVNGAVILLLIGISAFAVLFMGMYFL